MNNLKKLTRVEFFMYLLTFVGINKYWKQHLAKQAADRHLAKTLMSGRLYGMGEYKLMQFVTPRSYKRQPIWFYSPMNADVTKAILSGYYSRGIQS